MKNIRAFALVLVRLTASLGFDRETEGNRVVATVDSDGIQRVEVVG